MDTTGMATTVQVMRPFENGAAIHGVTRFHRVMCIVFTS